MPKSSNCECVQRFENLRKDYLNYYAVANVIGEHVVPSYGDAVLVNTFDFDLFSVHYEEFFECLGYVNGDVMGDYICYKCKANYFVPHYDLMSSSFNIMETCYKKIV